MRDILLGPPGLILLGAILSGFGALWAAAQQASNERELRELTQTALYSVTGGNDFCYLDYMQRGPGFGELIVIPPEQYPLYDVSARVVDLDRTGTAPNPEERMKALMGTNVQIGNLTPGFTRSVVAWHPTNQDQLRLNVFLVARNGGALQRLRRLRVKDGWAIANRVELNGKVVLEEVSASYPREPNGKVKWE